METAAILRSFHGALGTTPHAQSFLKKPVLVPVSNNASKRTSFSQVSVGGGKLTSSTVNRKESFLSYVKASESTVAVVSDADTSDWTSKGTKNVHNSTFPNGFETLILEVCDETDIAEVKLKVGEFEMHMKRNTVNSKAPTPIMPPIVSPTTAPPIPTKPMAESSPAAPPVVPQKSPPAASSPFANVSSAKLSKLAALEASGSNAYLLVSSPTVGSFRSGRTLKGKKQPPSCKEGDIIKEGQTIGYLDQFGNELPVRSDVAGEVLEVLYKDGEAVGYGDPLVAVLPSFPGIK